MPEKLLHHVIKWQDIYLVTCILFFFGKMTFINAYLQAKSYSILYIRPNHYNHKYNKIYTLSAMLEFYAYAVLNKRQYHTPGGGDACSTSCTDVSPLHEGKSTKWLWVQYTEEISISWRCRIQQSHARSISVKKEQLTLCFVCIISRRRYQKVCLTVFLFW